MDLLLTSLRIAVRALGRNKLRTALTMLGMIIGVGAVVTMVALGNGAQQTVEQDVRSAGTSLIDVNAGNYTRGGESSNIASGLGAATTLTPDDARAIGGIAGVKYYAPGVKLRGWLESGGRRFYTQILGTGDSYADMFGWRFPSGRFFDAEQVAGRTRVAVLGRTAVDRLFGSDADPVGRDVVIHSQTFRVIGVTNTTDENQIEMAFVPYTALQDALAISYLHTITVMAEQAGESTRIAGDITTLLRQRHKVAMAAAVARLRAGGILGNQMPGSSPALGAPDDFTVKTQAAEALTKGLYTSVAAFVLANMPKLDQVNLAEMTATLDRAGTTMTALLAGIAAISLIVGGIGIMNIMLVSVTERPREIGIRRAVGARRRDVMLQFLVEALTLSLAGGVIGIVFGFVASGTLTRLLDWPTAISASAIMLAFGIAAAVGVFFGFYPARRASSLDPIDALRFE
ncbi:MAG: ABC transporter permease [Betaproteobacteria bacterium]